MSPKAPKSIPSLLPMRRFWSCFSLRSRSASVWSVILEEEVSTMVRGRRRWKRTMWKVAVGAGERASEAEAKEDSRIGNALCPSMAGEK